jgi:cytochrome d ubiquinol oxidase subunit II
LVQEERYWLSFISSGITIIVLFTTVGIAIYPNLIPAINMTNSVSINAVASSEKTLTIMLTVALVGIPIILLYTFWIYKIFILKKISREIEYH